MKKRLINRWIYYRICRLLLKFKSRTKKRVKLNRIQDKMMRIVLSLIYDSNSELSINPTVDSMIGEKYYIKKINKNGTIDKYMTLSKASSGYNVTLIGNDIVDNTKHTYHYEVLFDDASGAQMIDKIIRIIRRRRNKMEVFIRKDYEKSLEEVLKNINKH
jgi:hypothetical protein